MGNRRSSGMASQLRDSFNVCSKIFEQKSEHPKVSWNALGPWSSTGHCLSRSSDLARNYDSSILRLSLRYRVQGRPMDNFSFSNEEALWKRWRLSNGRERIS